MSEEMEDAKVDYTAENFKRTEAVQDLGRETSSLYHNFGYDLTRKNNLCLIEDGTVIYAMGNNVVFESTSDGSRKYLLGLDDGAPPRAHAAAASRWRSPSRAAPTRRGGRSASATGCCSCGRSATR